MAYACRQKGIRLVVYAAVNANPLKVERMRSLGAEVRLFGNDFDSAKEQARHVAKQEGLVMIEDGLAVETIEGAGTIASELLAMGTLDAVLIPLGNGALFNGMATVLKALSPGTKRIAVQAAGAPAMADSWRAGRLISYESVNTIADGIGVRLPIAEALSDMQSLAHDVVTVTETSILAAMKLIHSNVGIVPEPSAAVGVAAILEDRNRFAGQRTATVLCGGNLTDEQMKTWLG